MPPSLGSSAEDAGKKYLDGLPLERRRTGGQVYTPPHLADFVLDQAGFGRTDRLVPLLDPSCGAGIFLTRAVAALAGQLGTRKGSRRGASALADAVEAHLFGVDIEEAACEMTRQAVRQAVAALTRLPLRGDFFSANVRRADFLFDNDVETLAGERGGFGFVVGNPPYVTTTRLTPKYKDRLRRAFQSASGRLDLYSVFMERSLDLLAPRGRLAMLTPDKFLISQSARELRSLLVTNNAILSVSRFRSHKVFSDAATVPCVTVVERGAPSRDVAILECGERPDDAGRVSVLERRLIAQRSLSSDPWHVHSLDRQELARTLQRGHPTLEHMTVRVSAGPATGRDGVFVFPRGSHPEIEAELLRPAVRGRDVEAFQISDSGLDVLLPYTFDAFGNGSLVNLADFPGARRYLQRHRAELEARHCVRVWEKKWYDLHDQMLSDLARQTKILVPDVANSNRFAVDRGTSLPLHSVYYLIPRDGVDPDYLCAVLNSRVARFLVRLFSPVVKDGFNRYRQQFLATLPIPLATTDQAHSIAEAGRTARMDELDTRIARLFRMSVDEYRRLDEGADGERT